MVPALAAEIPTVENGGVAADRKSVTWKLRKGVTWSDGTPFTAADVACTAAYCMHSDGGCNAAPRFQDVAAVEAVTTTLMAHYAKGVAQAALGNFEAADRERSRFDAGCAALPEDRIYANDTVLNVMAVARAMLYGEMAYHRGDHEAGFAHLREAVCLNDRLRYSESWPWMRPPRHALGALVLEQGRLEEAEQVYRADLGLDDTVRRCLQNRENVWSLHGYHECLQRMGRDREAAALAPGYTVFMCRQW